MAKVILSISRDHILLETRGAILRKSGHRVISVGDLAALLEALQQNDVSLIVVGHTLSTHDRDETYRLLQENDVKSPVIELYATVAPPKSPAQFQLAVHERSFQSDLLQLVKQVLSEQPN